MRWSWPESAGGDGRGAPGGRPTIDKELHQFAMGGAAELVSRWKREPGGASRQRRPPWTPVVRSRSSGRGRRADRGGAGRARADAGSGSRTRSRWSSRMRPGSTSWQASRARRIMAHWDRLRHRGKIALKIRELSGLLSQRRAAATDLMMPRPRSVHRRWGVIRGCRFRPGARRHGDRDRRYGEQGARLIAI